MAGRLPRYAVRRVLIYTHRWLGIAGGLLFIAWFVSGLVMMYERMPSLSPEERLRRLPALDLSKLEVAPADAARGLRSPTVTGFGWACWVTGPSTDSFKAASGPPSLGTTWQLLSTLSAEQAICLSKQFEPDLANGTLSTIGT